MIPSVIDAIPVMSVFFEQSPEFRQWLTAAGKNWLRVKTNSPSMDCTFENTYQIQRCEFLSRKNYISRIL